MSENSFKYYEIRDILAHNAFINLIVGMRGVGKTTSAASWCVDDYEKWSHQRPSEFVWIRRFKSELKGEDLQKFFDNLKTQEKYKDYEFEVSGKVAKMRKKGQEKWRKFGYFMALTEAITKKGIPYPNVNKVIFDEFIIDKDKQRHRQYLPNECKEFLDIVSTIVRDDDSRNLRCILMANAGDIVNPYFLFWNFTDFDREITKKQGGEVLLHYVDNAGFRDHMKETRFGKLIAGTSYEAFAVNNEFVEASTEFIGTKPSHARWSFGFKVRGETFGVWHDPNEGLWYIDNKTPKRPKPMYALTNKDHRPNLVMLQQSSLLRKKLLEFYTYGYLFFNSVQTREKSIEALRLSSIIR